MACTLAVSSATMSPLGAVDTAATAASTERVQGRVECGATDTGAPEEARASLGLSAMAAGLSEQLSGPSTYDELSFADRLGLLVD
jgi:hypothetical protein